MWVEVIKMDETPKQVLLDAGFRYAMSLVGEREAAEDLVGDVWLAVAKQRTGVVVVGYGAAAAVSAW